MDVIEQIDKMTQNLNKILAQKPFDKDFYIEEKIKFSKFCYDNNISSFSLKLNEDLLERMFVVQSEPLSFDIDDEVKNLAIDKIERGLPLLKNEVETILETVVNIARNKLAEEENEGLEIASLDGACGYGQALSYYPLEQIGIKTTINNCCNLPDSIYRHAFLTCFFKVIENEKVVLKQYLIDTTYRQFFTLKKCNQSKFYDGSNSYKNKTTPDVGYFLSKLPEGIKFSEELLKKGYIELNEQNARLYGLGFSAMSLCFENLKRKEQIVSHSGKEYIDTINDSRLQSEIDYYFDEVYDSDDILYNYNSGSYRK